MNGHNRLIYFIVLLITAIYPANVLIAEVRINNDYTLEYLFPSDNKLTFEQIKTTTQWQQSDDGWIRENLFQSHFWVGDTPKVAWLKLAFNLEQLSANKIWLELASSGVTRASLYIHHNGSWQRYQSDQILQSDASGNEIVSSMRSRFLSFKVKPHKTSDSIYLRVEASDKLHLQLNLKTNENFIIESSISNFIYAMGYGILLVMVFYNLFIGLSLRDSLYYIYSGAIFSTLLYQFFAHGHARIFASFNWDQVNYSLNFLVFLITTLSMYFLYYFCNLKIYTPNIARTLRIFLKSMILLTFISLVIPTNWSLNLILTIVGSTPLLALIIAIYAWFKGSPTAKIFIISWLAYIIGGFLWQGYWVGLITLTDWVEIPLIAGAAIESILLSLALAYRIRVLNQQTLELQLSTAHYKKKSQIDSLTQLANRGEFDQTMKSKMSAGAEFGLILFDIDYFKVFNDQHGHPAGDRVLIEMAKILKTNMRDGDLAARIGGEEFAAIISVSDTNILSNIANRIRLQFSETKHSVASGEVFCTTSAGFAVASENDNIKDIIKRADKALYRAKDNGRNLVQS